MHGNELWTLNTALWALLPSCTTGCVCPLLESKSEGKGEGKGEGVLGSGPYLLTGLLPTINWKIGWQILETSAQVVHFQ